MSLRAHRVKAGKKIRSRRSNMCTRLDVWTGRMERDGTSSNT